MMRPVPSSMMLPGSGTGADDPSVAVKVAVAPTDVKVKSPEVVGYTWTNSPGGLEIGPIEVVRS